MNIHPIDDERLAALITGDLPDEERAEVIRQLAFSPDDLDVLAAAASARLNPFSPTRPISPGMFIGRQEELTRMIEALVHTRSGQPRNFLVVGERGFGKSSLLFYLKALAEGRVSKGFSYLVIDTDVDSSTTQTALLSKIILGLEKKLTESEKTRAFLADLWALVRRIEVAGVSIRDPSHQEDLIANERFAYKLAETIQALTDPDQRLRAHYDGVLLLIDEAENSSPELRLGSFLKLLLGRLDSLGCRHFMIGVAGLPEMLPILRNSHPAALGLFEIIHLQRLKDWESTVIIDKTLEEGNRENGRRTLITASARLRIVRMAQGIPHLLQRFAHAAFDVDEDYFIDDEDVQDGTYNENGALATLGIRYGWTDGYSARALDCRWTLLTKVAAISEQWVDSADITDSIKVSTHEISEAWRRLEDAGLIVRDENLRGHVKLASETLRVLIHLQLSGHARAQVRNFPATNGTS
ncbi:ATP-binding protein [Longimicrobium terrae]|uniref:Type II secretory pathway predicted ATPase ExeA n=1 Tax=Longimicrobium terrae TaxID=1639882 RepID=A0A841H2X3_9BACT|nr:ATP-binding protein [Longimicrobium terrae]MBB4637802.1 type II secretory pathway predicted ATPase ExeA [Longimicrobium terrae]MBB6072343.1 type II secretory pathway predicted ATPase ExeA [Longimicrobium terrae]NNC31262.1 ATP-binding protein [Longimicrobium terrae]